MGTLAEPVLGESVQGALRVVEVPQLLSAARETWRCQAFGVVHQLAHSTRCFNIWQIELVLVGLLALSLPLRVHWCDTLSAGATVGTDQSRLAPDAHSAERLDAEALEAEQSPSFER